MHWNKWVRQIHRWLAIVELAAWSKGPTGVTGPWLGIGHDAPGITPARLLRFDACLGVAAEQHSPLLRLAP